MTSINIKVFGTILLAAIVSFSFIIKPTAYEVDTSKSTLVWTAKKVTGSHTGNINLSSGSLVIDNNVLKSGTFEIDVRSITATDITDAESNAKFIGHVKSEDFFGVEKHPKAKLDITSATLKADNQYDVKGNLTIKGITQPVSFPANVIIDKGNLAAKAKITIDRTKYDIRYRSKSFFDNLGDKMIYDDFDLDVNIVAIQK